MNQAMTSLKVGDMAPPFALHTGDGQEEIRLADILSRRAAILVFIRGSW